MNTSSSKLEDTFTLPQDECSQIFLKYFEGYNDKEIAAELNLPLGTVRERLRKGKQRIRVSFRIFKKHFSALINQSS